MINKFPPAVLVVLLLIPWTVPAQAQGGVILADPAQPISAELSAAVLQYLTAAQPAAANVYAVTYSQPYGPDYIVSLAGFEDGTPASGWSLEDGGAVWIGTIIVSLDGSGIPYVPRGPRAVYPLYSLGALALIPPALPASGAGGGPDIQFPFASGYKAYYGQRGVHGSGDYGTEGMLAVDFVGGDTLGADVMPAAVYASAAGEIDYVCDDGVSVAVRVTDGAGNEFIYAHLVDNENLYVGATFNKGQYIGGLVRGSFNDSCGWASQQDTNYHLHYMFTPASGYFQIENCILNTNSGAWDCGGSSVTVGGWIYSGGTTYGNYSGLEDDPGSYSGSPGAAAGGGSFFDLIVSGIYDLINLTIGNILPVASTGGAGSTPTGLIVSTIKDYVIFTSPIIYYLLGGNVNMSLIVITLGIITTFELLRVALYLFRFIKLYFPGA